MAPVVFLPNLLSSEKPFSLDITKSSAPHGANGTEAVSDLTRDTPVVSPSPQHAVKTPVVLWPQTPEPSDPDFAFFFPMQGLQESHSTIGQNTEASYNSNRTAGLPLQVLDNATAGLPLQVLDNAFRDMEGDELCFWASADNTLREAEYEDEQPFEFAPLTSGDAPPATHASLENTPVAVSDKEFLHQSGQCRPCAWFYKKPSGCQNGDSCGYCHFCPEGELKARKKSKVLLLKSGALEPKKQNAGTGPGAGRQLRLDPLVGNLEASGTSNLQ